MVMLAATVTAGLPIVLMPLLAGLATGAGIVTPPAIGLQPFRAGHGHLDSTQDALPGDTWSAQVEGISARKLAWASCRSRLSHASVRRARVTTNASGEQVRRHRANDPRGGDNRID